MEVSFSNLGLTLGTFFTFMKKDVYFLGVLGYYNHVSNKAHQHMKLIQTAPQAEQTFNVGDEIVLKLSIFDGRSSQTKLVSMEVTKVNRITIVAKDKQGNIYNLDPRADRITTRDEIVKETLASIA